MKPKDLERVMVDFTKGHIQCLVCTMIIESGLDLPNANTLIVNKAESFGLSQLYQLRGRVGRAKNQAFAYLLIPQMRKLKRESIKRLQTIQEYTHLGSGYQIAMRDLEIRGAGNVFGAKQSGFVDALGYDLYAKIIEEAIHELKNELNILTSDSDKVEKEKIDTKIELNVDAYLPKKYVSSPSERVDIYKRLIETKEYEKIDLLKNELIDRFGPLPNQAENLVNYVSLKILSQHIFIDEIKFKNGKIHCKFDKASMPKGEQFRPWIGRIVQKASEPIELLQENENLAFEFNVPKKSDHLERAKKFLQSIN